MPVLEPIRSEFADDPDYEELIDQFREGVPERIAELRDQFLNGDYARLRDCAHQLKGSGGGYGFNELSTLARSLELACLTEPEQIPPRLDAILDHLQRIILE